MIEQNYESKSRIDMIEELKKTVYITHNSDKRYGCMTTLELIEKYGIGHNCLSDAYALGMAHGLDGMENAVELAEKKTRVDAISEFAEWLEMKDYLNRIDVEYDWDENGYQNICGLTKDEIIEEYLEYVNDKKNEHDSKEEADIWLGKKGGGE